MKIRRIITSFFFIMAMLPMHAQLGIQPGWKIEAAIETSSCQDLEISPRGSDATSDGDIHKNMKAAIDASRTFALSKQLTLGLSAGYRFYNFDFNLNEANAIDMGENHHAVRVGGNMIYNTTLWKKPLIVMGNMTIEGGKWGMERISGIGAAMLMLKTSREEVLGLGLVGLANSTSDIPIFPMAFYRKVFSPQWVLNINHPFFGMQYLYDEKQTIMGGFAFENERFWLEPSVSDMPKVTMFNRSIMRTGINYEYKISKETTLTAQAGWEYTMRARMYHRNGHHEMLDFGNPNGLYAKVAFTYRIR